MKFKDILIVGKSTMKIFVLTATRLEQLESNHIWNDKYLYQHYILLINIF